MSVLPDNFTGKEIKDDTLRLAVRITLTTGLRISSLLSLKIEEISLIEDGQIKIKELIKVPLKGGRYGDVVLPPFIRREILEYIFKHRKVFAGPLFAGNKGRPLTRVALFLKWKKFQKEIGWEVPKRWHDLRHDFGHRICEKYGIEVARVLLHHRNIQTTTRYLHHSVESLKVQIENYASERIERK